MSLKDDFLRNRKVFELLTEPEGGADVPSAPPRQSPISQSVSVEAYAANPAQAFAYDMQEQGRPSSRTQPGTPQNTEIFSLKFGRRVNRETGMSLNPPVIEDIAFPKLQETAAATAADPLEGLYHKLESDARRASQLLGEEDF